ncbi:hypothetical protein FRACA_2460003 [Frankia canadensis]|uniref:Uncharacterized protein n=1 Tax=Frankia canadensis TaxID=1836972 RepID=A0A2I2KRW3_9ACTN|nr:hypothetical protein FRACA_2460003 [Frankia canadensis]SOU55690.1 hypothetical protein FRACA_2460003 [Frankia canadensis]
MTVQRYVLTETTPAQSRHPRRQPSLHPLGTLPMPVGDPRGTSLPVFSWERLSSVWRCRTARGGRDIRSGSPRWLHRTGSGRIPAVAGA